MKTKHIIFIISGFCVVFFSLFLMFYEPSYAPPRPSNLSQKTFWAGGIDGGHWFDVELVNLTSGIWYIKIYTDDGRPLVRGRFWLKCSPNTNEHPKFDSFDGRVIHLSEKNNTCRSNYMLPVGEHFWPSETRTLVITYPEPSSGYTEAKEVSEREEKPETW